MAAVYRVQVNRADPNEPNDAHELTRAELRDLLRKLDLKPGDSLHVESEPE